MAKKQTYKFRLVGGKTPKSWQLPLKGLMLEKKTNGVSRGLKKVAYVRGSESIFVEDQIGDQEPENIWFEDGYLEVDANDISKVDILFKHKWYGKKYERVDANATAEKKLNKYQLIETALKLINVSDEDEQRANAIVLIGAHVLEQSPAIVLSKLKEKAFNEPQLVIDEMSSYDYKAKYVAALAILKGVIEINPSRTAVTWQDGKTIVTVPAGQDPLIKIGTFLSGKDESATITLQEIGERTTRAYNRKTTPDVKQAVEQVAKTPKPTTVVSKSNTEKDFADDSTKLEDMGLEEAAAEFKEIFDKEVPVNKKNNVEWIKAKIKEGPKQD